MIIPKKDRNEICKYLSKEGVLYAKDYNLGKHPQIDVPNLQMIKLMQRCKSKEYVRETFSWQHYFWYLTNDVIDHLRNYLNLPSEIVPVTPKKSARPPGRPFGSGPPDDRPRGPPRFEGDRPRFRDRYGYRGGPPGAPGDSGVVKRVVRRLSSGLHSGVLVVDLALGVVVGAGSALVRPLPPRSGRLRSFSSAIARGCF